MKPVIYLAGPMANCSTDQMRGWRETVKEYLGDDFVYLDPVRKNLSPFRFVELVEADIVDIKRSDIVLAFMWKIGIGTSMEIRIAWDNGKYVYVVVGDPKISPWIKYHASLIFMDLHPALVYIKYAHGKGGDKSASIRS